MIKIKTMKQLLVLVSVTFPLVLISQNIQRNDNWWHPNGEVHSIAKDTSKGVVYVAGDFNSVGPFEPNAALLNTITGAVDFAFPNPNRKVSVSVSDGNGGWYIGGAFTIIGDSLRTGIAHINSLGNVTPWNYSFSGVVSALEIHNNLLYIGGSFGVFANGLLRYNACAIDLTSDTLTSWHPDPNMSVKSIKISGNTVYLGGDFTTIGGLSRIGFAAVDIRTGTSNSLTMNANGSVNSMVLDNSKIYIGGDFTTVNGQARNRLASIDSSMASLTTWNPNANGNVNSIKIAGTSIFVGGSFTNIGNGIGGVALPYLASVDKTTGIVNNWNANIGIEVNTKINSIEISGSEVYLAGVFNTIGGQERRNLGKVDSTANLQSWSPIVSNEVNTLSLFNSKAFVGGSFNSIGGEVKHNIAAFNATTGSLLNWTPIINGPVETIGFSGSSIYLNGNFTSIGGISRPNGLAEIDTTLGLAMSWNPIFNGKINAYAFYGNYVFLGGNFDNYGGGVVDNLVKINHTTKFIESFNINITPGFNNTIKTMLLSGDTLYFGGEFGSGAATRRVNLGAVNLITETVTSFRPGPNGSVNSLTDNGATIIVGGSFTTLFSGTSNRLVELNKVTGNRTTWTPNPNGDISNVEIHWNDIYASGSFTTISGRPSYGIARIDQITGLPIITSSINSFYGTIYSIASIGSSLVVAGDITSTGLGGPNNLIVYSNNVVTSLNESIKLVENNKLQLFPNPTNGEFIIRGNGYSTSEHSISVMDLNGRLIESRIVNPNSNSINERFDLSNQANGVYFISIRSEGKVEVKKVILSGR
ncbi:MAG: hypothetical protein ACJARP_003155 [Vicingaceae bacterium]|jgi:hypothetical protein